eukprot:CAMPEP_0170456486 /NCGR_PEP_ID=MMETSP0123-20130129/4104_1 /TAXON_ID=182087 /ORGANISM="Favella ehrenbergii, Strain Fehren 1" /LENGTH=44 /DNA_ID= /DNA_START= /DNA_END= /DNA_ORIENTATION=
MTKQEQIAEFWKQADTNSDKKVDKQELLKYFKNMLDSCEAALSQ